MIFCQLLIKGHEIYEVTLQKQLFKPCELNNWCKMVISLIFWFGRVLRLAIFSCFFALAALLEPEGVPQTSESQDQKRPQGFSIVAITCLLLQTELGS
jgi:hypothetical protein